MHAGARAIWQFKIPIGVGTVLLVDSGSLMMNFVGSQGPTTILLQIKARAWVTSYPYPGYKNVKSSPVVVKHELVIYWHSH